jgi:hypothetical protein
MRGVLVSKRIIKVNLDTRSINGAIRLVEQYKRELTEKTELFRKRIADEIAREAASGFANAVFNDIVHTGYGKPNVTVTNKDDGAMSLVIANGKDAVWCEFGAGVYHNGSVGSSPHPKGAELGFTIGSYGKGYGKGNTWGYYDGESLYLTHGTPAQMPMYNAVKTVCGRIEEIAREVFGA